MIEVLCTRDYQGCIVWQPKMKVSALKYEDPNWDTRPGNANKQKPVWYLKRMRLNAVLYSSRQVRKLFPELEKTLAVGDYSYRKLALLP